MTPTAQRDTGQSGVGLCLSGGGSRAMVAAMGQMRALRHLTTADGRSLLSQLAALSTVSGGSWLGVPWTFLTDGTSDDDFLNGYVDDPGRLVLVHTDGHTAPEQLDHLPDGNPGRHIGERFSIIDMLFELGLLRLLHDTPIDQMWQVITARRLLEPYGLYRGDEHAVPTSTFTRDADTRDRIVDENPPLRNTTMHLVADGGPAGSRVPRCELICNSSIFLRRDGESFDYLAPVQITPTTSGVLGMPDGTSAGRPVGGGSVTSFGLGSALDAADGGAVTISQSRQFSLADANGISSAAIAEGLQNWLREPGHDDRHLRERIRPLQRGFTEAFNPWAGSWLGRTVNRLIDRIRVRSVAKEIRRTIDPTGLVPRYRYWPVRELAPNPHVAVSRFADGGSLENTGIAAMLTRPDITSIIACVNSPDALARRGDELVVSSEIPVLFGLQPFDRDSGYVPYDGAEQPREPIFRHNQVFERTGFEQVTTRLRDCIDERDATRSAIASTELSVVANHWFGIGLDHPDGTPMDRTVTVVWVYLNPIGRWNARLSDAVRAAVDVFELIAGFPNYGTWRTELDSVEVNLLANQTSWAIANEDDRATFVELFGR